MRCFNLNKLRIKLNQTVSLIVTLLLHNTMMNTKKRKVKYYNLFMTRNHILLKEERILWLSCRWNNFKIIVKGGTNSDRIKKFNLMIGVKNGKNDTFYRCGSVILLL